MADGPKGHERDEKRALKGIGVIYFAVGQYTNKDNRL